MPTTITPGAKIGMQLCQCGHRAGQHDNYMRARCLAKIGMGRAAKPCACTRFTPSTTTNSTHTPHVQN